MQAIDLRLNENMEVVRIIPAQRKDIEKEYDYPNFPYICYDVNFHEFIGHHVHWHWHSGFQFVQILRGSVLLRTGSMSETLNPGDLCFINVNTNHCLEAISAPEECSLRTYTFYSDLLCGTYDNTLAVKYVQPIIMKTELYAVCIHAEKASPFLEHLTAAQNAMKHKEFGYEFEVRHQMTQTWLMLLRYLKLNNAVISQQDIRLRDRMRTMLAFIRTNYNRKIDLNEIADSALISQRECFRCFQKTMGITPTHYLQNYRIRTAARMLLETDDTISDISTSCGFNDTSYFGKTFQKYMNCSPSEFRKNHQSQYTPMDQVEY